VTSSAEGRPGEHARLAWRQALTAGDDGSNGLERPGERLIQAQVAGGLLLLVATLIAILWANSPWSDAYHRLLEASAGLSLGPWALSLTLHEWVNDALMAVFFLLVGLEIKREVQLGELAEPRAAMMPVAAALGGALVPAGIYALFNRGGPGAPGWGIPMATDIAFCLGCLALLGPRVSLSIKTFVMAVAIADDLIAVLVIALFYSGTLNLAALGLALALLGLLAWVSYRIAFNAWVFVTLAVLVWLAVHESGIHASITGVLLAMTVPAHRSHRDAFTANAERLLAAYSGKEGELPRSVFERQQTVLIALERAVEAAEAPLRKVEHSLVRPVNFLIMPIFALANAGVVLTLSGLEGPGATVAVGIALGLVLGKPAGLIGAVWLAARLRLGALPEGTDWQELVGAGILAGIGFTMSIFIAGLAFAHAPELLETAKLAVLIASLVAGTGGMIYLAAIPPPGTEEAD
jgi:NhaA family Na+:H+ antiporter